MVAVLRADAPDQQSDDRSGKRCHQSDVKHDHFRPPVPGSRARAPGCCWSRLSVGLLFDTTPSYRHLKTLSYKSLLVYLRSGHAMCDRSQSSSRTP
jgi:hypothetical protein